MTFGASLAGWCMRSPACRERHSGWCNIASQYPYVEPHAAQVVETHYRRRRPQLFGDGALCQLLELARDHSAIFDEITRPRLLHGDLWLFNLLIQRTWEGPRIVGVLDADRGSWGDPLADWTFFLLERRAAPQEQALFWNGYGGRPEAGPGARLRSLVYQGLHHGKILSVARRDGNERAVNKASRALAEVVYTLQHV